MGRKLSYAEHIRLRREGQAGALMEAEGKEREGAHLGSLYSEV